MVVHDPQPAGLIAPLVARGAHVVWRCHVGYDDENESNRRAWAFLRPYVEPAHAHVFSRESFAPSWIDRARLRAIPPSIDPFTPKNRALERHEVTALLEAAGLITGNGAASDIRVRYRAGHRWREVAARSGRTARRSSLPVGSDEGHARRACRLRSPRALGQRAARTRRTGRAGSERRSRRRGCVGGDRGGMAISVAIESGACPARLRPDGRSGRERASSLTLSKATPPSWCRRACGGLRTDGGGGDVEVPPGRCQRRRGHRGSGDPRRDWSPRRGPVTPRILRRGGRSAIARSADAERSGRNGRRHIEDRFLPDRHLLQYAELLTDLLGET